MSEWIRCSEGNSGPAWTCVLTAGHEGGHIYSLWSEIAAMAESELKTADAKIQAVRELHILTVDVVDGPGGPEDIEHCQECGYIGVDAEPCPTIRILDGGSDE